MSSGTVKVQRYSLTVTTTWSKSKEIEKQHMF
jgi:hypothetical protein